MPEKSKTGKGRSSEPADDNWGSLDTAMPEGDAAEIARTERAIETARTAYSSTDRRAAVATGVGVTASLPEIARGHYQVEHELARGGMGRIVRARDTRLGRVVAIKELLSDSSLARARFQREALITARLQHPAIVPLYEAGYWPDGEPFFAMKMVAGKPLDQVVRERKTLEQRLELLPRVIDVADALAYAHSEGVIHRDLKPANVLLGDFGETVVIDWGLAKQVGVDEAEIGIDEGRPANSDDAALTILGQAMGTPAYMPPEQARGEDVDKRADVYSLGAMLYHVLAGKMAYSNSSSAQEVLSKVLKGPPESLESLSAGIPADLLTIVNKAMARDSNERYQDAAAFAEELRRFEAGHRVLAHSYSLTSLLRRWVRKHRNTVAIALLLLGCLAVFAVWSFQKVRSERDGAMQAREDAMTGRNEAMQRSQELALNAAASLAIDQPLESLRELAAMQLDGKATATERAREIAAQARSSRIAQELTSPGSDHGLVALSPDSSMLAIVWHDKEVAIFDLTTRALRVLPGPVLDRPRQLLFSPNGSALAVADNSRSVHIWNLAASAGRKAEPEIVAFSRPIEQLLFSPDERWLALRSNAHIEIIDRNEPTSERGVIRFFDCNDMRFSPDSKSLAVAGDVALLYDVEFRQSSEVMRGRPTPHTAIQRDSFVAITYSPDGKQLAFADDRVFLFDVASHKAQLAFAATGPIRTLAFSRDGKTLAAGSTDTIIYLYRRSEQQGRLHTLTGHNQEIHALAFGEGDRGLLSAGKEGQLRIWQLSWLSQGSALSSTSHEILSNTLGEIPPLLSADGRLILAYDRSHVLRLWQHDRPDLRVLGTDAWGSRSVFAVGGQQMIWSTGGPDHRVRLQDSQGVANILGDHGEQVEVLAISSDDRYAVSGGATRLWLYDLKGHTKAELLGHDSDLRFAAFTDRGLVTADFRYGKIFLWNLQSGTGELVGEHGDMLNYVGVAVDPKGRWVATASRDNQIFLHHLIGDVEKTLLATSERPVAGMAASSDGAHLAMSLRQGEVSIFDPLDSVAPSVLRSPDMMESLGHPVFSPDNRSLVATNSVTGLRLWNDWQGSDESRLLRGRHESWFPVFSPDGKRIVAPGKPQGSASIWHIATGQRRDLQGHEVTGRASFWPESQAILVSSWNGVVNVWSDDLPATWPDLESWIEAQITEHAMPVQ